VFLVLMLMSVKLSAQKIFGLVGLQEQVNYYHDYALSYEDVYLSSPFPDPQWGTYALIGAELQTIGSVGVRYVAGVNMLGRMSMSHSLGIRFDVTDIWAYESLTRVQVVSGIAWQHTFPTSNYLRANALGIHLSLELISLTQKFSVGAESFVGGNRHGDLAYSLALNLKYFIGDVESRW